MEIDIKIIAKYKRSIVCLLLLFSVRTKYTLDDGRKNMNSEIAKIFCDLYGSQNNSDEYNDVIRYIGLVLEKHTFNASNISQYNTLLPINLVDLELDKQEQYVCVYNLWAVARCKGITHGIIWAIGKANWTISLEFIIDLIQNITPDNGTLVHQSLMSFDGIIVHDNESEDFKYQTDIILKSNLILWLTQVEKVTTDEYSRYLAKKLLNLLGS